MVEISRRLRQDQTPEEKLVWSYLRRNHFGFKFRRQEPISNYIPDFVCYDRRVIVELDGSQHLNSAQDKARDEFFTAQGWRVLRFWNSELETTSRVYSKRFTMPVIRNPSSHQAKSPSPYLLVGEVR